MGIFDIFKNKNNKKKLNSDLYDIKNMNYNKVNLDDIENVSKIVNNHAHNKLGSKKKFRELQSELDKYKIEEEKQHKIFEEYYNLFNNARKFEKTNEIDKAISIYLDIIAKYKPQGTSYYERPAILLEKEKNYQKALEISLKGKQMLLDSLKQNTNTDLSYFDKRIERLQNKILNPPKSTNTLLKRKASNLDDVKVPELYSPKNELSENVCGWNISISFGKSSSSNYNKAVFLAKQCSNYHEEGEDKNIIHQATYSSAAKDYLNFISLYELVGSWKSSFVFINGEVIDRKIIGKLNYCYGDKCRSGNNKFCYGASEMTDNPFGCHRLQISAYNNPWWTFGMLDRKKIWHVDKKAILERINQYCIPYKNCPSFSYDKILYALNNLPDTINLKNNKNWQIQGNSICPKNYGASININDLK